MKNTTLVALAVLAAACGGSGTDPASVKFTYGAGTAPQLGSGEASALSTAEATLPGAPTMVTSDASVADPSGGSLMSLGDSMASECMGSSSMMMAASTQAAGAEKALALATGTLSPAMAGLDDPSCVTVTPGLIEYKACTLSMTSGGMAATVTLDGSVTRAVAGGTANVSWDLRTHMVGTAMSFPMDTTVHHTGALAIGASTIAGTTRSDTTAKVTVTGMPMMTEGVSVLATYDLHYRPDPFCITTGTLEVRRVFTERPTGATASDLPDQGVLFTWVGDGTACGAVKVAWGTKQ